MKKRKSIILNPLLRLISAGFGSIFIIQYVFYLISGPYKGIQQNYLFLNWCGDSSGSSQLPKSPHLFCEGDSFPLLDALLREVVYLSFLAVCMFLVIILIIAPVFIYFLSFIKIRSRIISWALTLLFIITELAVICILDYRWNIF